MMLKKYAVIAALVVALLSFASSPGCARDEGWKFHLTPYLWMSGLHGDVAMMGLPVEVDASFGDIWSALDMAFMLHAEVEKGRWGFLLDPAYMKLSKEAEAGPTNVEIELTDWLVDVGAFYSLYHKELSSRDERMFRVDALAGGRYMSVDVNIGVTGIGDVGGSKSWVDPIVGGRMMADFTEKLRMTLRGDLGGFGIGSNFAWSFSSSLGYRLTPTFSLWAGYRALGADYEDGSAPPFSTPFAEAKVDRDYFKYDVTVSGPAIGLGFTF